MKVFKQTKTVSLKMHENCAAGNKLKKWFIKWDMTIAALTAVVIFTALLIVVIYKKTEYKDTEYVQKASRMIGTLENSTRCVYSNGTVECSFGNLTEVIKEINKLSGNHHSKILKELQLYCESCNSTLQNGWLAELIFSMQILKLQSGHQLGANAFAEHPFNNLQQLTLYPTASIVIRRNVFRKSPNLTDFSIQHSAVQFEANALEGLASSLTSLQLQECIDSESVLENVTGRNAAPLVHLESLDLRNNNLKVIGPSTFQNVPYLLQLYLSKSMLIEIDKHAFDHFYNLQSLYLSDNDLETLPGELYKSLKKMSGVYIDGNNWNCVCELQWLKKLFLEVPQVIKSNFICRKPFPGQRASQVDFCNFSSSTTSLPVTDTSTSKATTLPTKPSSTTQVPDKLFITVQCMQDIYHSTEKINNGYNVHLRNRTITMEFYQKSELPLYEISVNGDINISEYNLLWTSAKKCMRCLTNLQSPLLIEYLDYEETYQFCLIKHNQTMISPYDCTILTVPPEWGTRTWLSNDFKLTAIVSLSVLMIATIFITGFSVFCWVRQHPTVIKGNKRVIVAKSQTTDAIILPKKYARNSNITKTQSFDSTSDGYLTPKNRIYSDLTEDTIVECTSPSIEKSQSKDRNSGIEPPPLPPNHPSMMKLSQES